MSPLYHHCQSLRTKTETPSPIIGQNILETPREILDISSLSALPATVGRTKTDIRFPVESPQAAKRRGGTASSPAYRNGMDKTGVGTQRHLPTGRMFKGNIRIVTRNPLVRVQGSSVAASATSL